jgi:hypothetical protein
MPTLTMPRRSLKSRASSRDEASRLDVARSLSASASATSAAAAACDALDDEEDASFVCSLLVADDDVDEAFGGGAGGRPGNAMPSSSNMVHLKLRLGEYRRSRRGRRR